MATFTAVYTFLIVKLIQINYFVLFFRNEAKVDEVCWELCKTNYIERDNPLLTDECVFMLFRIFCMLGEMVENDRGNYQLCSNQLFTT